MIDRWLDRHQREPADGLDGVLDVEAGLREVLLQSRHDTAVDALGSVLDAEGGLAAIVPAGRPDCVTCTTPSPGRIDPVTRLALRAVPRVVAAYEALNHTYFRTYKLVADLTRVRELLSGPGPVVRDDLVSSLQYVLDLTHFFERDLEHALMRVIDSGDARSSGAEQRLERAIGLTDDLVGALDRAIGHANRRADHDVNVALLQAELSNALNRSYALVPVLIRLRVDGLRQAIGSALDMEPPPLDSTAVRAFLDDFTTSDLRAADLSGLDLGGVRWSESGTRWPATVDVDDLKARSEQEGGGIWVVRSGTTTMRDLAGLA
ncbi:hypothetical protein ACFYZH_23635 [Streptomyces abikoensis]|uniref:hypothetical protein n=1 Tax=Streptomyces abikoensis TaxID=97398 RepID=UPI0036C88E09